MRMDVIVAIFHTIQFWGTIPDVGDNHFGYVGFRDTNGKLRDNGAMDVVVEIGTIQKQDNNIVKIIILKQRN